MVLTLLAQTADEVPTMAVPEVSDAAAKAAATGVGLVWGGLMLFWVVAGLLSLVFFIWWIVLIIDLTKRDWPGKTTYLILMIVALFVPGMLPIMDLVYYFGVVKKGVGSKA